MTSAAELMERAAESYEKADLPLEAARCYEKAGLLQKAAACLEKGGEPLRAAEIYRRAGVVTAAARLFIATGRPEDAAACHEQDGDMLGAGWILARHTTRVAYAHVVLTEVAPHSAGHRLQRSIGLGLCVARLRDDDGPLVRAVLDCEASVARIGPVPMRRAVSEWAVQAADQVGRIDLAARIWAAAYRAGVPGSIPAWRTWAMARLGGTLGIPEQPPGGRD